MKALRIAGLALLILAIWIVWDLSGRREHDLRDFDPHEVARIETAMWRSYYDHQPVRLFGQMTELLRSEYGFPFWRSVVGGFYAARAAEVFQAGHQRSDYERALPGLRRYYAMVRQTTTPVFDVNAVARLELEWWIIHRQQGQYTPADLDRSLAELQAAIYSRPAILFAGHAQAREIAMLLRDAGGRRGSPSEAEWRRIGTLLDSSWDSLHKVVTLQ